MARYSKTEREDAKARLLEMLSPGDTIYTVLRHVSKSGMMRAIDVYAFSPDPEYGTTKLRLSSLVAAAADMNYSEKHEAIRADGCGMDMGYHIMTNLGRALFPDGFGCTGKNGRGTNRCPSNDHSNGDRDHTKGHEHKSGDYAFHHEWI